MSTDESRYSETDGLVAEENITEVRPPQTKLDYNYLIKDYLRGLTPYCIQWLTKYNRQKVRGDFIGGLTVGVVLIPQGMAYGLLAGLPPIYGLYASIIAPIIYCIFGTSMQLSVGPVAITGLLTAAGVKNLGPSTTEEYIQAAILLGFVSGAFLLLLGLLRFGFIVDFLSNTVLSGFISASACIIFASQLKDLLGISGGGDSFIEDLVNVFTKIKESNGYAVLGSIFCLALLFGIKQVKKMPKWVPVELLLMLFAIFISYVAHLDKVIKTVGEVPSGFPPVTVPNVGLFDGSTVVVQALIIAIISYIGSIALARGFAFKHGAEIDANQELIALGAAGLIGAFFSGHPVSGSFSRTAINNEMGAQTPLSGVVTASIVIFTLLLLTPIFEFLPKLVLASIVVVSVRNLLDYKEAIYLWKTDKSEFAVLASTFLCTLIIGIDVGIIVSIVISLSVVLFRSSRPEIVLLGRIPNTVIYRNIVRHPQCETYPGLAIIRIDADLYFANVSRFKKYVYELIQVDPTIHAIIIDSVSINYMDATCLHILESMITDLEKKNVSLVFAGAHATVRETLAVGGITPKLKVNPKIHVHAAVQHFLKVGAIEQENDLQQQQQQHSIVQLDDN